MRLIVIVQQVVPNLRSPFRTLYSRFPRSTSFLGSLLLALWNIKNCCAISHFFPPFHPHSSVFSSAARPAQHRGKTSTHAPGVAFPALFSVKLSSQIKVSRALSASFCVQLVVQLFCFIHRIHKWRTRGKKLVPSHESEALEDKQKLQMKTFSELAEC